MTSKRLVEIEDIIALDFVGDPQVKGNLVLYTVTTMDEAKNGYDSVIRLHDLVSGDDWQFAVPPVSEKTIREHTPRWSPDGKNIFFLSNRNGREQIFLISASGGEARQLGEVKDGIVNPSWSPCGSFIAFAMKEPKTEEPRNLDVKYIRRLRHKMNGVGFIDERRRHLWLLNVSSGEVCQVTKGDFDVVTPTWTPCGGKFVFATSIDPQADLIYIPDLFAAARDGSDMTKLTAGLGPSGSPAVSPCGRYLAYVGHEQGEKGHPDAKLYVMPLDGGERVDLTESFAWPLGNFVGTDAAADRGSVDPVWKADSSGLHFVATVGGEANIFFAALDGQVKQVTIGEQSVTSFSLDGERLACTVSRADNPGDIFLATESGLRRLTRVNDEFMAMLRLTAPQRLKFTSTGGAEIEGWIMPPTEMEPGLRYPLILHIHGGPHVAYGNAFFHEFQLLASRGYGVLYINPRGSRGYGEDFTGAVVGDWGGVDYQDFMAAVDYAAADFAWVDDKRLGVTGGSYGGYMTNWIVGQTDRFKAAVTLRCISNMYTKYGTSDIGFYGNKAGMGGADLWDQEEFIMSRSPIRYAPNVKTPTMIIHSEEDYRCPMEQAEQWFTALKRLGVDVEFVRFAGENHELSRSGKPRNRKDRLFYIADWFRRYL